MSDPYRIKVEIPWLPDGYELRLEATMVRTGESPFEDEAAGKITTRFRGKSESPFLRTVALEDAFVRGRLANIPKD